MRFLVVLFVMALAAPVAAQVQNPAETPTTTQTYGSVFKLGIGANGVWYDGDLSLPPDFEVGANASASLSPHISAVGSAYYGFDHSYLRGAVGARITATDVNDPNFSIGLGAQYHVSSETGIRPQEWASDVTVGWKPFPEQMKRITVGAQSWYGFTSKQVGILAGVRYAIRTF